MGAVKVVQVLGQTRGLVLADERFMQQTETNQRDGAAYDRDICANGWK